MAALEKYHLDALRKLRGDALVTHPDSTLGVRRVERVFSVPRGQAEETYLVKTDGEYTDTVLVEQYRVGGDANYVEIYQAYENLPGSWIPFTRYDDNLGPIQGRRRAVANSGQTATLTATAKTTYEGRNGSAAVLWQIEENWSDGTGSDPENPVYPINRYERWDDTLAAAIHGTTQLQLRTGLETATQTESGGVITKTTYDAFNEFLLLKRVETWAAAGATYTTQSLGQQSLIPAKYRRLVRNVETNQPVDKDYSFPSALTGDQTFIELAQFTIQQARLRIISEILDVDADPLVGEQTSEHGILFVTEELVDEGEPADEGFLVIKSTVDPLGNGKSIKITVTTEGYPVLESELWDDEMRIHYPESREIVPAGTGVGTVVAGVLEEIQKRDAYTSYRVISDKTGLTAINSATAILSEKRGPFKFPGRFDVRAGYGGKKYQAPSASLVPIYLRTWWVFSATKPTLTGISDIFEETLTVIERSPITGDLRERTYEHVLHDAGFYPGVGVIGETTPSFEDYTGLGPSTLLTGTISYTNGSAVVTGTGTSFTTQAPAGSRWFGSTTYLVSSVTDDSTLTLNNPIYFGGPSPAGGYLAWVRPAGGSMWIGTERVVGATCVPAKEPNLWKVETQSVVMR